MKKLFFAAAALAVSAAMLVSCGQSTSDKTASEEGKSGDTLVMATNAQFPPYEYYEGDKIVGIDAEIGEAIAEKLGKTLKIEDIEFDSIVPGVQTGKYDFGAAGMTVTEEREKSVSFTDTYAKGIQAIIVKDGSPITSPDDLTAEGSTYKAGVQLSTTGDIYATDDMGSDRVQEFQNGADAVAALVAGKIDCVIIDNEPAKSYVAANAGLKVLDTKYAEEDYALCVAKDNTELLDQINGALSELKSEGKLDEIVAKYIK